uniref:carbohydrate ABC transporter permease n=1 Tax=Caldanaerobius polysaccharolyticus TaxID=44256 RepID=UPI00068ABB59
MERSKKKFPLKSRGTWHEIWKNRFIYLYISPFYILFLVFGAFPIIYSFILSFNKWDGIGQMQYVGLSQYRALLQDHDFWQSIANTFIIWVESTIPMLFFALVIAFLLNAKDLAGREAYKTFYFLPNVTSIVAVAIIFGQIFGNYGIINFILTKLGLQPIQWRDVPHWVQVAISSMVFWRWVGYNAIIYLAGLQRIPTDLYEAATVDGATKIQIFFKIVIPLLNPIILFTVITSTIGGLQLFTEPQVFVGNSGGPNGGGMTIVLYLYNEAFVRNLYGYASAVAWALAIIIFAFSAVNWFATKQLQ